MKRIFITLALLITLLSLHAQSDVTKFLGIPVDGNKNDMIYKLKSKGFKTSSIDKDILTGVFNGHEVYVHVVTNRDKVCRIMVSDVNKIDERSIQIRFNTLCQQFKNNPKYISLEDFKIPDDEDISYEMTVNKKRYEAAFYQKPVELEDTAKMKEQLYSLAASKFSAEELANPTEEIEKEALLLIYEYLMDMCPKKSVWFMISKLYGEYYITMFYDNEYNRANGEEL